MKIRTKKNGVIIMAGYDWKNGMSNNAVDAYENGEKPISKWTKSVILEEIENMGWNAENFRKYKVSELRRNLLEKSSWHHTSKFFNQTVFYALEEDLTEDEAIKRLLEEKEKEQQKKIAAANLPFKVGDIIFDGSLTWCEPQMWQILNIDKEGVAEVLNVYDDHLHHGRWIININIIPNPLSIKKWELYF